MQSSYYADSAFLVRERSKAALHYAAEVHGHLTIGFRPFQQRHMRYLAHVFLRHVDDTICYGILIGYVEVFEDHWKSGRWHCNQGEKDRYAVGGGGGRMLEACLLVSPARLEMPAYLQLVGTWMTLNSII